MKTETEIIRWPDPEGEWFWVVENFEGRSYMPLSAAIGSREEAEKAKAEIDARR